ncbi:class I SAM-dependent methyltransferase [Candidatus Pacearchaeota archaeon]|nr:class I SAM-dependent methyltransferase [Candidatus Pacearchaeota archaeon]
MVKNFLKKIIYNLCLLRNKLIEKDDFNWSRYHKNYENQINECEKVNTLKLSKEDFNLVNGKLEIKDLSPPIHPNHELLYKIIYDLQPNSILEIGCGNGDHLLNLKKIMPSNKIKWFGCDLLEKQLSFLNRRNPSLKETSKIFVHDITVSQIPREILKLDKLDLIYTQTVIMHIQKNNNHLKALRNLFYSSNNYIVLMENWTRHNFYGDLLKISKEETFPWEKLYFYKVNSGKRVALVLSKTPIKNKHLKYELIKDNNELLKYER